MEAFSNRVNLPLRWDELTTRIPMSVFRRLFTEHPASVGETYAEHFGSALYFGTKMIVAGVACVVHGVLPALFVSRGSDTIRALYERMVTKRRKDCRRPIIE